MDRPFLIVSARPEQAQTARDWARRLNLPFTLAGDKENPADKSPKLTLRCTPFDFSQAEQDMLMDALRDHEHMGADLTLENPAFVPNLKLSIVRAAPAEVADKDPRENLQVLPRVKVNRYVPCLEVVRRNMDVFEPFYAARKPGLILALTEKCNLRCGMCPFNGDEIPEPLRPYYNAYRERRRSYDLIDFNDVFRVLDLLSEYGPVHAASFIGPGEPFRHPRVAEIIEALSERGLTMNFTTNGTLLSKDILDRLLRTSGTTMAFSVDAVKEETYRKIRSTGDFNKVRRTIDYLLERRRGPKHLKIMVSFIRQPVNLAEEESFVDHWRHLADEVSVVSKYHAGRPEYPPEWTPRALTPCAHLENSFHVLVNGDCWACSAGVPDEFFLGNIFTRGPGPVLAAQREYARLRYERGYARELCQNCNWWRQTRHVEIFRHGRLSEFRRPYSYKIMGRQG